MLEVLPQITFLLLHEEYEALSQMFHRGPSFNHQIADKVLTSEEVIGCQDNVCYLILSLFITSYRWIESRIFLLGVIVLLKVISDARQVPELSSRFKCSFKC